MKRGAEKYLTDRNADEEEEEDEEVQMTGSSEGFKQAAPTELARRPIRGLPGKRSAATTPAASPAPNGAAPKPAFSFGSPGPATSFSFGGGSPALSTTAKPSSNGFSFGGSSAGPSSSVPKSSSPSNADQDANVQYYSSLRGLNLSVIPPLQRLLEEDPFTDLSEALSKILARYKEERSSIEGKRSRASSSAPTSQPQPAANKQDAQGSASSGKVQASKPMFSFAAPSTTSSVADSSSAAAPEASTASAAAAAPKPFTGFSFGGAASSSAPKAATPVGEQPAAPKPFSGFAFGSAAASTPSPAPTVSEKKAEEPKSAAVAEPSQQETSRGPAPPAPPAVFSFAGSTFKPDPSKSSPPTSGSSTPGGFTFNPSKAESTEKSKFSFPVSSTPSSTEENKLSPEPSTNGKSSSNNLSSNAAPFFPGTNSRARQPSPLRQVETLPTDAKDKADGGAKAVASSASKPFSGFSFGGPPASATPATSSSATPSKTFSFGSGNTATSPKSGATFGFGASGGSPKGFTANVGFSFGSPQPTASSTSAPSTSAFSFGSTANSSAAPAASSAFGSTSSLAGGSSGGFGGFSFKPSTVSTGSPFGGTPAASSNGTPAPEGDNAEQADEEAQTPSENSLLKGGAGEENEETIYEARAKLWKNETRKVKEGDAEVEKTEFVDHGISIVKLNRNKETGKVRMLGRSDANGRVQINFVLFKDLTIKFEKSFLTFMAFENGSPMLLRLKLRNAELAGNLKNAIEVEVSNLS